MDSTLRIVLIEDVDTDAELIQRTLRNTGLQFIATIIETPEDFQKIITLTPPDLILSDYTLPRFNALEALKIKKQVAPDIPFILVTGAQTEEIAVACIKEGADDYILKGNLTRLPTAVHNALKTAASKKDRSNALKELRLREEKYRNLFETSMVGILRWRLSDAAILEYNQKAKEFTQLFCDEGNLFNDCFLNKEDYDNVVAILKEKGIVENIEFQVNDSTNSPKWLSLSAKLFEEMQEVEGVLQDISASKESMIELQKINYELDRFVYHASHDLKSPLRAIQGLVDAARESETLEECLSYVEMFEQCASKLEVLVNDLLLLARANRVEELITEFDLEDEINGMLNLHEHIESFRRLQIEKVIKQEIPFRTDAVRLRIILNNLISNAIKYHRIDHPNPFIKIVAIADDRVARIEISDNGEGIAENHLARIFDMFFRASRSSEGSGLGLYIVKSMVEHLNGKIKVISTLGQGTSFIIEVPNHRHD